MTATAAPAHAEIERLEAPSREVFERDYVARRRPVILTGVASKWRAFTEWTPDYLRQTAGDSPVTVHYDEDGDFQRWYSPKGLEDREMPLREFVDIVTAEPPDRRFYMTEHSLKQISPVLASEDVDISDYIEADPFVFIGRDTMMPLHYHGTTEAVLCQLVGTKEIVLYPPEESSRLYSYPWWSRYWHFSRVGAAKQATAFSTAEHLRLQERAGGPAFPKFDSAKPIAFTLHPGEILFIPVQWWHVTTCPGFQMNVTYFWASDKKRYRYPNPGLQVVANGMWKRLRGLSNRVMSPYG